MKAPSHFNETAARYFDLLKNFRRLKSSLTDHPIIERLAFNLSTVEECEKQLIRDGFVMEGLHGKKEHPAVAISMKAQSKVLEAFKLLGLDASQRFKEEQAKPEDLSNDPLLKILGRI